MTVFVTQPSGQEDTFSVSFEDEDECYEKLSQTAALLSSSSLPRRIAYSIENPPPFIEKRWEEFLLTLTSPHFVDPDFPVYYVSGSSFSGLPTMSGWGSSTEEPQAQSQEAEPFFALRLTPKDKKNISILLTDLADKSYLQLLAGKDSMHRKGAKTRTTHPMRFIGYILSDRYLHSCLKKIEKDGIKYKEFLKGFEDHMREMAQKEDLLIYAPGLAELIGADTQSIVESITSGQYAQIVKKFL